MRKVYWNHTIGWLRLHDFLLGQEKDTFDAFIHHVSKNLDINRAHMKYQMKSKKGVVTKETYKSAFESGQQTVNQVNENQLNVPWLSNSPATATANATANSN